MPTKAILSGRKLYVSWAAVSLAWLAGTRYIDPYFFGISAFATAFVSSVVVLAACVLDRPRLHLALLASMPTVVALMMLSSYKWA